MTTLDDSAVSRPSSIGIVLRMGWLWFTLFFVCLSASLISNPAEMRYLLFDVKGPLGHFGSPYFLFHTVCTGLLAILLVLVSRRQNSGHQALNVMLWTALIFTWTVKPGDFMSFGAIPGGTGLFLVLFFLLYIEWIFVLVMLIALNRRTSKQWFAAGLKTAIASAEVSAKQAGSSRGQADNMDQD